MDLRNQKLVSLMNRRNFTLALPGAVLLAEHINGAIAQEANRPAADTDSVGAARMRSAASAFLGSLDELTRKKVVFPLAADQRASWSNLPVGISPRVGVGFGALETESKRFLHALLRASTSSQGYHKICEVMRHDDLLRDEELDYLKDHSPKPRAGRDAVESMGSANYWVSIFGDPTVDKSLAWLLTGHHLGATFTLNADLVSSMPLFLGAAPVEELAGKYAGLMALSHEALRGFDLVRSLRPEQAKIAILSSDPLFSDVLTGVHRRESLARFEGIAASQFDPSQKRLLFALIAEYVGNADFEASDMQIRAVEEAGLDKLYFSWRGPTDVGQPFYYRVHGPRLIIEFAVQEPNHVHTIMRDPKNDYGMDWLGLHYEEHTLSEHGPAWRQ